MGETDHESMMVADDRKGTSTAVATRGDDGALARREAAHASGTAIAVSSGDGEIERLQAEIEAARLRLASSMELLREEVRDKVDWKRYVRENPWKAVGVAFAVGFFFGSG